MMQELKEEHRLDDQGNPAGGQTTSVGLQIEWQNGPLGRGPERKSPNGAFVETLVCAAIGRLKFYQGSKFKCAENERALVGLNEALFWMEQRTKGREERGVEGINEL